jgi:hypothetical protein
MYTAIPNSGHGLRGRSGRGGLWMPKKGLLRQTVIERPHLWFHFSGAARSCLVNVLRRMSAHTSMYELSFFFLSSRTSARSVSRCFGVMEKTAALPCHLVVRKKACKGQKSNGFFRFVPGVRPVSFPFQSRCPFGRIPLLCSE